MAEINDFWIVDNVLYRYNGTYEVVQIPDTVKKIGNEAFRCSKVKKVVIPEGVEEIGTSAFKYCESLCEVMIPASINKIARGAFDSCSKLEKIVIPEGITEIPACAFAHCDELKTVELPSTICTIGDNAFFRCQKLESIRIPFGVQNICTNAFYYTAITELTLPETVETIGKSSFGFCTKLTSVQLPSGLKQISDKAFEYCVSLSTIQLPAALETLGNGVFYCCGDIDVTSDNPQILETMRQNEMLIRNGVLEKYYGPGGIVCVPDGVKKIGNGAFLNCIKLTAVELPDSVTEIGIDAFKNCTGLADENGLITVKNILFGCKSDRAEIVIPENVKEISRSVFKDMDTINSVLIPEGVEFIGDEAFKNCVNLKEIRIPAQLNRIGFRVFENCSNLKTVYLPENISVDASCFEACPKITFHLPEKLAEQKIGLSSFLCKHNIVTSAKGYAYLSMYQRSAQWQNWHLQRKVANPTEEFEHILAIIKELPLDKKLAKPTASYIQRHHLAIESKRLKEAISVFEGKKCKEIEALHEIHSLQQHLGKEVEEENPIETLAKELLSRFEPETDAEKAVKNGIHWKDSKSLCSRDVLICLLSCYIRQWNTCSVEIPGELTNIVMLRDGSKVAIDPDAELIAAALDANELSAFLTKLVKGPKYRSYLLAWARFANDEDIRELCSDFKTMLRGKSKERYMAENLEQALLISDRVETMLFYDRIEKLDTYAAMRGKSATELRDTAMMPDFGFDADGVNRYDIGETVIEVFVDENLDIALFDHSKNKAIRSFPKKAEDAAKDFAEFKKEIKSFIKLRSEQLCRMQLSGESIDVAHWQKIYLNHPVIKQLSKYLVWVDSDRTYFSVINGIPVDINLHPYEAIGKVRLAHVLEMSADEISAWQALLSGRAQALLFEQIWEPKLQWSENELREKYKGITISSKLRNTIKSNLKRRGIDVHSGEMEREFNARAWSYDFSNENTMFFGKSLCIEYTVSDNGDIIFGKVTYGKLAQPREMNAIILELDKAAALSFITKDQAEKLSDAVLDNLTAAQIGLLLDSALSSNAVACTARLLNYKNDRYPAYDNLNEFVLDW